MSNRACLSVDQIVGPAAEADKFAVRNGTAERALKSRNSRFLVRYGGLGMTKVKGSAARLKPRPLKATRKNEMRER